MSRNFDLVRKMGCFDVIQRTSDGMFDGNALLKQWNSQVGNPKREMKKFLDSERTKAIIRTLNYENENVCIEIIKGGNTKIGRTSDQVWMSPLLLLPFCEYLGAKIYLQILKSVNLNDFMDLFDSSFSKECDNVIYMNYDGYAKEHICEILKKEGFSCVKEYEIGDTRFDVYCPELNLLIECDGGSHNTNRDKYKNKVAELSKKELYRYYDVCEESDNSFRKFIISHLK